MIPVPGPIDPKVKADVAQHLLAALALLQPYQPDLTKEDQKSLASKGMGRDSIPFAQQAGQVLTGFTQVLSRSITDEVIAQYPAQLATFDEASELQTTAQAIADLLAKLGLVAGAGVMEVARLVYKNVQDDNGRTPGLRDLEQKMAARYATNGPARIPKPAKV
ncbi:hypothetical protein [Hymenobacter sp. PAMC 26628]|uniref:hypothetical protein n=1 Tax=Hymenobacter sp. PAMC 26628 TaxID=1484118 RepID=UPI0007703A1E|nr:hypothetical protein [Hymenobacter sp. PAMC 26628]AMJ65828.1 hypothetical protein AXW84_10605 [Hymenobacter sp. PAMC 26628]